jgi:hypothetical protein
VRLLLLFYLYYVLLGYDYILCNYEIFCPLFILLTGVFSSSTFLYVESGAVIICPVPGSDTSWPGY